MAVTESLALPAASDPTLQPFLQADFDPVSYLNNTLPTLSTSSSLSSQQQPHTASLVNLSAEIQSLLNRLTAQTTRLSGSLTQLTDEIIRSGGRLAYEVELLRGEAIGLTDALNSGLKDDLGVVLSAGSKTNGLEIATAPSEDVSEDDGSDLTNRNGYMGRLHILATARERLDAVMKIFDEAMKWPMAPSELAATASSIISIAAPTNDEDVRAQEAKAREFNQQIEAELQGLSPTGSVGGDNPALQRLSRLKEVANVWRGTVEERARSRRIDNLQKLVEEKQDDEARTSTPIANSAPKAVDYRYGNIDPRVFVEGRYDFLHNLRSAKD